MKFKEMPYKRVDYDKTAEQFKTLTKRVKEAKSGEELWEIHQEYYKVYQNMMDSMTIAEIRHDGNTADPFYAAEKDYYDETAPMLSSLATDYQRALYESPYRSFMEEKIGKVAFATMDNAIKSMDESIIGLMQEENALTTQYNKLIASAKIPFDGQVCNLSLLRPYLTGNDRTVRRQAWKAYSDYFMTVADELDDIYDKLVKNRTAQAKAMGYDNYIQLGYYRMNRNSYDRNDVENFRRQVKEVFVPFAERVHEIRRKRLGLEKLSYIDNEVYFKEGNPDPVGTAQEILESGQKMYAELSPETKEFFDFMMENELFDVFGRKDKKQGGYMTYLYQYHSPFIFANFNGTNADVNVLTHEAGHAFEAYTASRNIPVLSQTFSTAEISEIHSMAMEYFTLPWMHLFFGENAEKQKKAYLWDSLEAMPYMACVDEFQHRVYAENLTDAMERRKVWHELEKIYLPWRDYDGNEFLGQGGFWMQKQHLFMCPFYYIDYAVSRVGALEYYGKMQEDLESAWKDYYALCRQGGSKGYHELLRIGNLSDPFKEGTIYNALKKLNLI